jgi:hypothetical protein
MNFGFHKTLRNSCVATQLAAFQEGLSFMNLFRYRVKLWLRRYRWCDRNLWAVVSKRWMDGVWFLARGVWNLIFYSYIWNYLRTQLVSCWISIRRLVDQNVKLTYVSNKYWWFYIVSLLLIFVMFLLVKLWKCYF